MATRHIISLAGDLASGKGTISKILMEKLNYGIYRNGEYFRKLAKEHNMSITEFNVYVKSHPEIVNDPDRKETESLATLEEQKQDLIQRYNLENERYFKLYNVHRDDLSNYDYICDTSNITPEEAADKIIEEYKKWLS